ncbi:MAG: LLM class flavin-dependent oxidoreductase [Gordonia sp. (in: high G+C Gram-positive bacteria)]
MAPTPLLLADLHHSGDHEAAWRLPGSPVDRLADPGYYVEFARLAADGGFDAVFFVDFIGFDPVVRSVVRWPFEPTTLTTAVLQSVPDIAAVVTASTVFATEDQLHRTFATLDDLSGGRIGWNIVTTGAPAAARAFGGGAVAPHDERYRLADGLVADLVARWTGNGGRGPVRVQAGSSPAGRDFAARHAEVVFTAAPTRDAAAEFRSDLRRRAERAGRDPDTIRVLPGILTTIGETDDAARALRDTLNALITEHGARRTLAMYGVELPAGHLDAPLPPIVRDPGFDGIHSRAAVLQSIADDLGEAPRWRDLVNRIAGSRGHLSVTGSGATIAAVMNDWLDAEACDGFVVKFAHSPAGARDFVDQVSPLLTARGIGRGQGWPR